MNFRNIDLKDRIVRRVYHRFLIVVSGVLFIALFSIILPFDDAFPGAFGGSILFYATGHALYWGVYWVMQGFQPTPRPNPFLKLFRRLRGGHEEDDYSSLYMLRIIRNVAGDHGFSSSALLEDTFSSTILKRQKEYVYSGHNFFWKLATSASGKNPILGSRSDTATYV